MKREEFKAVAAMLLLATLAACGRPASPAAENAFPDFRLASLQGSEVTRADFANRVVLYDFWATWCGPCHLQADIFRELYPNLTRRGVEIVGIATGEEPQTVRDFVAKRPYPWPMLVDSEERLSNALEVVGLPTTVITCRSGAIAFRATGIVEAPTLERELAAAESC